MFFTLIGGLALYIISLVIISGVIAALWWVAFHFLDDYIEEGGCNQILLWLRGLLAQMLIFSHLGLATSVRDRKNRWRGRIVLAALFIVTMLFDSLILGWYSILWGLISLALLAVPDDTIDEFFK